MKTWIDLLNSELGIVLDDLQKKQFEVYQTELLEWNKQLNLTAIRDPKGVQERHFFNSLTSISGFAKAPKSLIDVGSGAGFPGIPIKLVYPQMRLTLVESVEKKANFCRILAEKLNLKDVLVVSKRAEEVGRMPEHREQYEIAIARAVAPAPTLAEYLLPLARVGGRVLMQKGVSVQKELAEAKSVITLCGGELNDLRRISFDEIEGEGFLVIIDKLRHIPKSYPRAVGTPAKKPILSPPDCPSGAANDETKSE